MQNAIGQSGGRWPSHLHLMNMPRRLLTTDTRHVVPSSSAPPSLIRQHRKTIGLACLPFFLAALLTSPPGEKVDMLPQHLRETATHIIVGTVLHVFRRQVRDETWDTTYYVAETRVTE